MINLLKKRILAIIVNSVLFISLTILFYFILGFSNQKIGEFNAGLIAFAIVYLCPSIANRSSIGYLFFNIKANSCCRLSLKYCISFVCFYIPGTLPMGLGVPEWGTTLISFLLSILLIVIPDILVLFITKGKCDIGDYLLGISYNGFIYPRKTLLCQIIALFPISLTIILLPYVGSKLMWFNKSLDRLQLVGNSTFSTGYFPEDIFTDIKVILQNESRRDVIIFDNLNLFINSIETNVLNVYILVNNKIISNISKRRDLIVQLLKYIRLKYIWENEYPKQVRLLFLNIEYDFPFIENRRSYLYYYDWDSMALYGGCDIRLLCKNYQDICKTHESIVEKSIRACNNDSLLYAYKVGNKIELSNEVLDTLNKHTQMNSQDLKKLGLTATMIPFNNVLENRQQFIVYEISSFKKPISLRIDEYYYAASAYDSLMHFKNHYEKYIIQY